MSVSFPGAQLLSRLESEMRRVSSSAVKKVLPDIHNDDDHSYEIVIKHFPDLYGFRGMADTHKDC